MNVKAKGTKNKQKTPRKDSADGSRTEQTELLPRP